MLREGRVQMLSQRCLDLMEFSSHAISPGLALELETTSPRASADEDEPQELEGFRPAEPTPAPSFVSVAPKLDQPRLHPVQLKPEMLKSRPHGIPELPRISLMLEAQYDIVRVTDDDDLAPCLGSTPSVGPEIEDVMQEHVCKQWLDHRSLDRTRGTDAPLPFV